MRARNPAKERSMGSKTKLKYAFKEYTRADLLEMPPEALDQPVPTPTEPAPVPEPGSLPDPTG